MNHLLLFAVLTTGALSWDDPVQNVDGSPLIRCVDRTQQQVDDNMDCLDSFTIYHGTASRVYDQPPIVVDETVNSLVVAPVVEGTIYFAITASDRDGNESAFSNEVSKLIEEVAVPLPPVILLQPTTVFTVIKQRDRFVLLPIGTVPAGTECDPNNSVNGHEAVPREAVDWTCQGIFCVRPEVVVAQCDG